MNTANPRTVSIPHLLASAAAAAALGLGVAGVAAATATTEPPEPMTSEPMTSEPMTSEPMTSEPMTSEPMSTGHSMDEMSDATLAVDGSADASSPEVEAFCSAEVATELAFVSEDPTLIGPASEALLAAAPADIAPTVQAVLDNAEAQGPDFEEAYAELIDYMKANCGWAEIEVAASDYAFAGIPTEMPAGGLIITIENIGEELHVVDLFRINDDVTLTLDELLAVPEEEIFSMVTQAGSAFAMPGATGYGTAELTPGRYVAICPIPQGLTPEVAAQLEEGPTDSAPAGSAPAGSAPVESAPAVTAPADTAAAAPEGSATEGSAPDGSGPGGPPLGPPHFVLGMVQEFTVV